MTTFIFLVDCGFHGLSLYVREYQNIRAMCKVKVVTGDTRYFIHIQC